MEKILTIHVIKQKTFADAFFMALSSLQCYFCNVKMLQKLSLETSSENSLWCIYFKAIKSSFIVRGHSGLSMPKDKAIEGLKLKTWVLRKFGRF